VSKLFVLILILCFSAWCQQSGPAAVQSADDSKSAAPRVDTVHKVDPGNMYHRVWAVVPLIGSGTKADDPRRPMFVPAPSQTPRDRSGILSYQMQLSDDGKWALVEFVGATPQALEMITKSADPNVKVFERGKSTPEQIETEFKKYKATFSLSVATARPQ
jgi:hypothetical protein